MLYLKKNIIQNILGLKIGAKKKDNNIGYKNDLA